jgi:two-component system sensor histidine kinase KdpD
LLALATLERESERVVRRAWRSAQRLDADLDVLVIRAPGRGPSVEDRRCLESLRRLTSMLGARLRVEEGDDPAGLAIAVAQELGSTYVLIGTPRSPRGLQRLRRSGESMLGRLIAGLPGVDIRVVADPALRRRGPPEEELPNSGGVGVEGGEGLGQDGDGLKADG